MAKQKAEEPNLFDTNFESLEIESEKKENELSTDFTIESDIMTSEKSESNITIITEKVTSQDKRDSIEAFILLSQPLVEKAIQLVSISNDDENTSARNLGTELTDMKKKIDEEKKRRNKPLKEEIDANGDKAKKLIEPLDNQINRIKSLISVYETEKENKRKAELERIAKEKKEREEKEAKERERVSKIRNEIQRLRTLMQKSVNDTKTLAELDKIKTEIKNWKPKESFFMEFFEEVNVTLRNESLLLAENRTAIVTELEEQKKKADELESKNKEAAEREKQLLAEKIAADNKKKEQDAALKKAQDDAAEFSARNELTVLVASLGVKDFEGYIDNITKKYGNCREAVKSRDQIISSHQEEQEQQRKLAAIESQKIKNQRVDYIFNIDDETKVPREYLCVDESKIKKAIQENRASLEKDIDSFKIDGITISTKVQTVLKK